MALTIIHAEGFESQGCAVVDPAVGNGCAFRPCIDGKHDNCIAATLNDMGRHDCACTCHAPYRDRIVPFHA